MKPFSKFVSIDLVDATWPYIKHFDYPKKETHGVSSGILGFPFWFMFVMSY